MKFSALSPRAVGLGLQCTKSHRSGEPILLLLHKFNMLLIIRQNLNDSDYHAHNIIMIVISDKARHTSLPGGASNPRLNPGRRVNTFSGLGSTEILNKTRKRSNIPQRESAQPVLNEVTSTLMRNTESDSEQINSFDHPVLTSTPMGVANLNHGSQSLSSNNMRQKIRHVSENLRVGNTSSPFPAGNIGRSDSFPASISGYEPKPPSTSTSHELFSPSTTSQSDLSSTAGEMLQYNENALRMGIDSIMVQTHTEAQDRCQFTHPTETPLFAVGPPATSEFNSIPPSPSFPAENQVSYDHRFDSRERRANSVIPIEYVLINEQLHKVRTFQVPPGQDYRRSFTPPASIPLAREATLVEPTLARPRVTSPLSEHNRFTPKPSHTGDTDQSIERSLGIAHDQFHSLPRQPLLAPVGHISTQEPEVKHGWPVHELISDVQQSGIQKGSAFSQINSSSTDTLTKSVSPPLLSSTPPSKGIISIYIAYKVCCNVT